MLGWTTVIRISSFQRCVFSNTRPAAGSVPENTETIWSVPIADRKLKCWRVTGLRNVAS